MSHTDTNKAHRFFLDQLISIRIYDMIWVFFLQSGVSNTVLHLSVEVEARAGACFIAADFTEMQTAFPPTCQRLRGWRGRVTQAKRMSLYPLLVQLHLHLYRIHELASSFRQKSPVSIQLCDQGPLSRGCNQDPRSHSA